MVSMKIGLWLGFGLLTLGCGQDGEGDRLPSSQTSGAAGSFASAPGGGGSPERAGAAGAAASGGGGSAAGGSAASTEVCTLGPDPLEGCPEAIPKTGENCDTPLLCPYYLPDPECTSDQVKLSLAVCQSKKWKLTRFDDCEPILQEKPRGEWGRDADLYTTEVSGTCGPLEMLMLRRGSTELNYQSCEKHTLTATACQFRGTYEGCTLPSQPRDTSDYEIDLKWAGTTWVGTYSITLDGSFVDCNGTYAAWMKP